MLFYENIYEKRSKSDSKIAKISRFGIREFALEKSTKVSDKNMIRRGISNSKILKFFKKI